MAKQERYTIGPGLLRDIKATIQKVDALAPHTSGPTHGVRYWDMQRPPQPGARLGTISATWSKGSTATVTRQNGDGTAITGSPTFTAKNYFSTVLVPAGTRRVACALIDSTWVLIAAEC